MAYDEGLAQRAREFLAFDPLIEEKKMFGGIAFFIQGNLCCGVLKDALIVRVGPNAYEECLSLEHTRVFDITGRSMKGWVMVDSAGCETEQDLRSWIQRGIQFASTLPAK